MSNECSQLYTTNQCIDHGNGQYSCVCDETNGWFSLGGACREVCAGQCSSRQHLANKCGYRPSDTLGQSLFTCECGFGWEKVIENSSEDCRPLQNCVPTKDGRCVEQCKFSQKRCGEKCLSFFEECNDGHHEFYGCPNNHITWPDWTCSREMYTAHHHGCPDGQVRCIGELGRNKWECMESCPEPQYLKVPVVSSLELCSAENGTVILNNDESFGVSLQVKGLPVGDGCQNTSIAVQPVMTSELPPHSDWEDLRLKIQSPVISLSSSSKVSEMPSQADLSLQFEVFAAPEVFPQLCLAVITNKEWKCVDRELQVQTPPSFKRKLLASSSGAFLSGRVGLSGSSAKYAVIWDPEPTVHDSNWAWATAWNVGLMIATCVVIPVACSGIQYTSSSLKYFVLARTEEAELAQEHALLDGLFGAEYVKLAPDGTVTQDLASAADQSRELGRERGYDDHEGKHDERNVLGTGDRGAIEARERYERVVLAGANTSDSEKSVTSVSELGLESSIRCTSQEHQLCYPATDVEAAAAAIDYVRSDAYVHEIPPGAIRIVSLIRSGLSKRVYRGVYNPEWFTSADDNSFENPGSGLLDVAVIVANVPSEENPGSQHSAIMAALHKQALLREALTHSRLCGLFPHPNLVSCVGVCFGRMRVLGKGYHVGRGGIQVSLIVELCGTTLQRILSPLSAAKESPTLSLARRQDIAYRVINALVHLHRKKIVHGNLSLEHILFKAGKVKVCDFGTVTRRQTMQTCPDALSWKKFTVHLAPEQCQGIETEKSDIYAFGLMLLQLFAGVDGSSRTRYAFLAKQCLSDEPDSRPTAAEIRDRLDILGWHLAIHPALRK